MDPLVFIALGQIRQQEILEQAEHYRHATPIWERLWTRLSTGSISQRRKPSALPAPDECSVSSGMVSENC